MPRVGDEYDDDEEQYDEQEDNDYDNEEEDGADDDEEEEDHHEDDDEEEDEEDDDEEEDEADDNEEEEDDPEDADDEEEDEEEDEEDDDEEEDEADDNEEEEDDPEDDFIEHDAAELSEDNNRRMHRPMLSRDEQEEDFEDLERRIQERYSRQHTAEYDEETIEAEQQALLPSVRDSKLWIVKCVIGHEREVAICLMQKAIDKKPELQIRSAIALDHLKNYIYIEAEKDAHVTEAIKGMRNIFTSSSPIAVPIKEMTDVLSVESKAIDELEKFQQPDERDGDIGSLSSLFSNRKKGYFMKGDTVIIVNGVLRNLKGWVKKVEDGNVHIRPNLKGLPKTLSLNERDLCKYFEPGSHVKVVTGLYEGSTGIVVKVEVLVLIILLDTTKDHIGVLADHVVESSEVTKGATKNGDYELHDLVLLDNMSFGVIIGVESEAFQVLKGVPDHPEVVLVRLREIKSKVDQKVVAQDHRRNPVSVKDVVEVIEGPFKGKQGPVEHIHRGVLFIYDRHHLEHAGFICAKSQACLLVGGSKGGNRDDMGDAFTYPAEGPESDCVGVLQMLVRRGQSGFLGLVQKVNPFVLYKVVYMIKKKWVAHCVPRNSLGEQENFEAELLFLQKKSNEAFEVALKEARNFARTKTKNVTLVNNMYVAAAVFLQGFVEKFEGTWKIGSSRENELDVRRNCASVGFIVAPASQPENQREGKEGQPRSKKRHGNYQSAFLDIVRSLDELVLNILLMEIAKSRRNQLLGKEVNPKMSNIWFLPTELPGITAKIDEIQRACGRSFQAVHEKVKEFVKKPSELVVLRNISYVIAAKVIQECVKTYKGKWIIGLTAERNLMEACGNLGLRTTARSQEPVPVPAGTRNALCENEVDKSLMESGPSGIKPTDDDCAPRASVSVLNIFSGIKTRLCESEEDNSS